MEQQRQPKDEYLVRQCFKNLNAYKRERALCDGTMSYDEKAKHELKMFKMIDQLELNLRGLQKEVRLNNNQADTESEDD